ncbi:MAG: type IV toxin-antitoxin system AbiEi family antitoxin, partial [Acidobacteriota bacterium]
MKKSDIAKKILDLLLECLRNVPNVRNLNGSLLEADSADLDIEVQTNLDTHCLIVAVRNNGQPRYAREAIAQLLLKSNRSPENTWLVFAAPFISESAAAICLETGAGYIDLSGNCRLSFNGIFIEQQGRPNRFLTRRSLKSLYQARSTRVLRALLFDPKLKWKLADLSTAAGVSIGQVYNVKKSLVDREWAEFDTDGLRLIQPEKLLRNWGDNYAHKEESLSNFRTSIPLSEMESSLTDRLSNKGLSYALTAFSASARFTSFRNITHSYIYIDRDMDRAPELLELKPSDPSNITLMIPYDEGVFFGMREVEEVNVVSPVQAYLDLAALGNDGEEAA